MAPLFVLPRVAKSSYMRNQLAFSVFRCYNSGQLEQAEDILSYDPLEDTATL